MKIGLDRSGKQSIDIFFGGKKTAVAVERAVAVYNKK